MKQARDIAITGPLTVPEMNASMALLVKLAQKESFATEIRHLKNLEGVQSDSRLKTLNPF